MPIDVHPDEVTNTPEREAFVAVLERVIARPVNRFLPPGMVQVKNLLSRTNQEAETCGVSHTCCKGLLVCCDMMLSV